MDEAQRARETGATAFVIGTIVSVVGGFVFDAGATVGGSVVLGFGAAFVLVSFGCFYEAWKADRFHDALQSAREEIARLGWGVAANAGRLSECRKPRWSHVQDATGLGSKSARSLCRKHGFDPNEEAGGRDDDEESTMAEANIHQIRAAMLRALSAADGTISEAEAEAIENIDAFLDREIAHPCACPLGVECHYRGMPPGDADTGHCQQCGSFMPEHGERPGDATACPECGAAYVVGETEDDEEDSDG